MRNGMHRELEAFILHSKILQNWLYRGTLKYSGHFSEKINFFFHKWDLSQVCGKQHPFYPPVFKDFPIDLEAK